MSDKFVMSARQSAELDFALERNGCTPEFVKWLSGGNVLARVRQVQLGHSEIKPVAGDATQWITINSTTIVVNLGVAPKLLFGEVEVEQHIGDGWVIVEKRADGLYVSGRKVVLYLSKRQKGRKWLKGHELREELTGKPVLNANILDALVENPHLIPDDWKADEDGNTRFIYFWGTIYRGAGDSLCVRYLFFYDGAWIRRYFWLHDIWDGSRPAASLES